MFLMGLLVVLSMFFAPEAIRKNHHQNFHNYSKCG